MLDTKTKKQWQSECGGLGAGPAVELPLGQYQCEQSSSGLWNFIAEDKAFTVKRRGQAGNTKPALYLMAEVRPALMSEVRPKPVYVSSLYFISSASSKDGWGLDLELTAWTYTAQAAGADSPLRFVTFYLERAKDSYQKRMGKTSPRITVNIHNSRIAAENVTAQRLSEATDLWQVFSEGPFFVPS